MTLKRILGGLLDVIFPSFEVQKPGTGDRDVYYLSLFKPPIPIKYSYKKGIFMKY